MSRLKEGKISELPRESRAIVKIARIARANAWNGGASALVIADRLERMGSAVDYHSVVSAAYSSSTGTAEDYLCYECPECGCSHVGAENAYACCADNTDFEDDVPFGC